MVRVSLTKEEFMHAYSSQYYDPAKAHEYYERTKKLKGRSTSGMSDRQKEAWNYVKEGVTTEKKQKMEEINTSSSVEIEELRNEAIVIRERIAEKLAKLTASTSEKRSDISEEASGEKSGVRDSASQERKVVAQNLKTAISSVREKVKEIKEALNTSTEETLDREYENIMANIAGKPAKAKKGKGSSGDVSAKEKFIADNLAKLKSKS